MPGRVETGIVDSGFKDSAAEDGHGRLEVRNHALGRSAGASADRRLIQVDGLPAASSGQRPWALCGVSRDGERSAFLSRNH